MPAKETLHPFNDNGEGTCPIVGHKCPSRIASDVDTYGGTALPEAVSVKVALEGGLMGDALDAAQNIERMVAGINRPGISEKTRGKSIEIICSKCREFAGSVVGRVE